MILKPDESVARVTVNLWLAESPLQTPWLVFESLVCAVSQKQLLTCFVPSFLCKCCDAIELTRHRTIGSLPDLIQLITFRIHVTRLFSFQFFSQFNNFHNSSNYYPYTRYNRIAKRINRLIYRRILSSRFNPFVPTKAIINSNYLHYHRASKIYTYFQ